MDNNVYTLDQEKRIAMGEIGQYQLDDVSLPIAAIFRKLLFQFANEETVVKFLENVVDEQDIEDIDTNDRSHMKI